MRAWLFNMRGRLTDGGLVMLNAPTQYEYTYAT